MLNAYTISTCSFVKEAPSLFMCHNTKELIHAKMLKYTYFSYLTLFLLSFTVISCQVDLTKDMDEVRSKQLTSPAPDLDSPTLSSGDAPKEKPDAPTVAKVETLPTLQAEDVPTDTVVGNPMLNVPSYSYLDLPENSLPLFTKSCLLEKNPSRCSSEAIQKWFTKNLSRLPEESDRGASYVEYVSFTIDARGKVINVSHAGTNGSFNAGRAEIAVRIVQNMPDWIPGRRNGKPVSATVVLPVRIYVI